MAVALAQGPIPETAGWLPITDEERKATAPTVEKDAGLEALLWRVHVTDERKSDDVRRVYYHYVRLKVFNEKGREKATTIEIPIERDVNIPFLLGRTVKADGSVVELGKDAIFEREVVRVGNRRQRVKAFAMPGVEPGAIVEYRWQEVRWTGRYFSTHIRMPMQREYPVRKVTYFLKPLPAEVIAPGMAMVVMSFNCQPSPLKLEPNGYDSLTLENVPARQSEPYAPSDPNVQPWSLAFYSYSDDKRRQPERYWLEVGKDAYKKIKSTLKMSEEMKKAVREATADASTQHDKVLGLLRYLRAHLTSLWDASVDEARRNQILNGLAKNRVRTSADVFKSGIGTEDEMNSVFAALATEAGLDARPALVANWNEKAFQPTMTDKYFLNSVDMAVKLDDQWRIFDVSTKRLPPQMLSWMEEGAYALISDPREPIFVRTPISPPEASHTQRSARLKLSEDGAIEGDVEESSTGHEALDIRQEMEDESAARRQELVANRARRVFPEAEVSEIGVDNIDDPAQPVKVRYHIKVAGYAQRTARRILLSPFFFQRGISPRFTATQRKYPIMFRHGWRETDQVLIQLPSGFRADSAASPASLGFGETGEYRISITTKGGTELIVERDLIFGRKGNLIFDVQAYPQVKAIFDGIHSRDNHTVALSLSPEVK